MEAAFLIYENQQVNASRKACDFKHEIFIFKQSIYNLPYYLSTTILLITHRNIEL